MKTYLKLTCGSLFVQIFAWAMYSVLEMQTWLCGLSVVVTALLYHFICKEEMQDFPRKYVFFAGILTPFLLAAAVTIWQLAAHPNLNLLGAHLDGVSPLTELVSLYAARLTLNGIVLLIFAAVDKAFLQGEAKPDAK